MEVVKLRWAAHCEGRERVPMALLLLRRIIALEDAIEGGDGVLKHALEENAQGHWSSL